jgi:predicted ATPase
VLALLKNAPGEFDKPIRESGCPLSEWFWKSSENETQSANIEVTIPIDHFPVSHQILFSGEERLIITSETVKLPSASMVAPGSHINGSTGEETKYPGSNKSLLSSPEVVFKDKPVLIDFYQNIRLYKDWTFGRKSPLRFAQLGYLSDKYLNEDGDNLGVVLRKIKANEESHARYLEFLKQLYEDVDDYEIDEYKDGTLRVYLCEGERRIHAARLSDGTLRYLMLMAVLCDPEPPPVVCIEEPEMGLHPDLIHVMAKALEFASVRTQVIVTTHSDRLVDCFTHSPEVIRVCEKHEGQTFMEKLDPEKMSVWLDDYRLGDLWTSGEIGGNRW